MTKGVKLFTSGRDQPFIIGKYKTSYAELSQSTSLVVDQSKWSLAQYEDFFKVLVDFKGLELALTSCSLGLFHACALAKALEVNTSITEINLCNTNLGPEGGAALAKALEVNTSITKIGLSVNRLGPEGGAAL